MGRRWGRSRKRRRPARAANQHPGQAGPVGLNVTHFGYEKPGEAGWDKDSAKGNGKYVENLIPGYDVALNSASAALVGNPKPGETFQYAGREWRYGDAVSEKLKDPRFDIFDPAGTALAGGMPVGRQIAGTTTATAAPIVR